MTDTHWQVQDAKQRFSELIRRAQTDGAQVVTKHGTDVAVVMGMEEFKRLSGARPDFKEYLLSGPRAELTITRSPQGPREVDLSDV
jgi:prevent-host-death family protein